jgi:purine-nucleoside/S-methyl-5'-thioadenosine phosphorylase / adenosine deaminase
MIADAKKMESIIEPPNMAHPCIEAFFTMKTLHLHPKAMVNEIFPADFEVYMPVQRHTDRVIIVEKNGSPEIADAVLTQKRELCIGICVADCIPALLFDKRKLVAGAVHAGWRGTAAEILKKAIQAMIEHYQSWPDDIMVALGPSIKGCCYEVDSEVRDELCGVAGDGSYSRQKHGKYFVDLSSLNMLQALSLGVPQKNIWVSDECTYCNHDKYHSYRYHKDHAGRQGGFIRIR